jgi:hypothetical protein
VNPTLAPSVNQKLAKDEGIKMSPHSGPYQPNASTSCISPEGFPSPPSAQKRKAFPLLVDLTDEIVPQGKYAAGIGGFADVFKALWNSENVCLSLTPSFLIY